MRNHIWKTVTLLLALAFAPNPPALAQRHKPVERPRPTQSKDKLHEMAKKSGGHFVLRYKPNRSTLYPNVEELAKRSDVIVIGRTLSHRSRLQPDGNFITQDFLVKVQEVVKGDIPNGRSIVVTLPGGSHRFPDGTYAIVEPVGNRPARDSGIYVFFLKAQKKNSPFKGYLLASEMQGMFELTGGKVETSDASADNPIVRNYRQMSAPDFLKEIHKAVPRKGRKDAAGK
ncbi:MAG TPA: hypothetical protein VF588_05735 [Pyrinomonadaceae bacterium]|jgi:hypothetical protein